MSTRFANRSLGDEMEYIATPADRDFSRLKNGTTSKGVALHPAEDTRPRVTDSQSGVARVKIYVLGRQPYDLAKP
jgi:hypothetical protein